MKLKSKSSKDPKVNTTAKIKRSNGDEESLIDGTPLDPTIKHLPIGNVVGSSIGVTKNMGDYESLRVDVWATTTTEKGETSEEAIQRLQTLLQDALINAVCELTADDDA